MYRDASIVTYVSREERGGMYLKKKITSKSYYFSKTDIANWYYPRESFRSEMCDKIRKYTELIFLTFHRKKKSSGFYHNQYKWHKCPIQNYESSFKEVLI